MDVSAFYQRVFLAITIPDALQPSLAGIYHQLHHEAGYEELRWVKPALQHLTLHFIGGIAGGKLVALMEELKPRLAALSAFNCDLGPLRLFPNLRKAHCLILRVSLNEHLQQLIDSIHRALDAVGVPRNDRVFRPHITLARIPPKIRRIKRPELELPSLQLPVNKVSVLSSTPDELGVQYETLAEFFFQDEDIGYVDDELELCLEQT